MNNLPAQDAEFLAQVRRLFASSLGSPDEGVLAHLRAARQRAVAEIGQRVPLWRAHPWTVPGGAVAVLVIGIAAGLLVWNWSNTPNVAFATANNNDIPIVLSNDNLDMYANMDFYRWLQAQHQDEQAPSAQSPRDSNG